MNEHKKDPLHGITLEQTIMYMVEHYGWEYLAEQVNINCFKSNPSVKSSLTFLRKTPWARTKLESLYLYIKRKELKEIKGIIKGE